MRRRPVYPHTKTDLPGETVYQLRIELEQSQRALADKCNPRVNHTTIRRLENNLGFKKNTLDRVAKALDVHPVLLFYPPEVAKRLARFPIERQRQFLARAARQLIFVTRKYIKRHS